jgi:hypothetical protein
VKGAGHVRDLGVIEELVERAVVRGLDESGAEGMLQGDANRLITGDAAHQAT